MGAGQLHCVPQPKFRGTYPTAPLAPVICTYVFGSAHSFYGLVVRRPHSIGELSFTYKRLTSPARKTTGTRGLRK